MDTIKQILIDSLNGMSADLIPLFLLQLLCAALLSHLLQKIFNSKFNEDSLQYSALTGTGVALLTSIVKYSVSFSVLAAAAILLFSRNKEVNRLQTTGLFLVVAIGIGCGTGSVIQTIMGFVLLIAVLFFIPVKK
ncbi:MAG: hypothetical protein JNJ99_03290 [Crocinitomicaceae bacterium]|nr:hypothetical protein [Crocinitomicaceae bacterium]